MAAWSFSRGGRTVVEFAGSFRIASWKPEAVTVSPDHVTGPTMLANCEVRRLRHACRADFLPEIRRMS